MYTHKVTAASRTEPDRVAAATMLGRILTAMGATQAGTIGPTQTAADPTITDLMGTTITTTMGTETATAGQFLGTDIKLAASPRIFKNARQFTRPMSEACMTRIILSIVVAICAVGPLRAETVNVRYGGAVDLSRFECREITRSSFIRRVCYLSEHKYMVINLDASYYHYCSIGTRTVNALVEAGSMGQFYNANIRSRGAQRGPFDCRDNPVPQF